jgi:pSer/pThr/pTyr-binding forkhead associated (FHA) protein
MFIYSIAALAIMLLISILYKTKQNRLKKLQEAAYEILKEEALNKALQNSRIQASTQNDSNYQLMQYEETKTLKNNKKRMIHLAVVGSKPLISYVFNPEKVIQIGRNKDRNTICLKDTTVSSCHCEIYMDENHVLIKDLGSANKTYIKRRGNLITLEYGDNNILLSRDIVIVGGTRFRITLFDSDIITL